MKICKTCLFKKGVGALGNRIIRSQRLAWALGKEIDIGMAADGQDECPPKPISRAEFFTLLRNKASENLVQGQGSGSPKTDESKNYNSSQKRKIMLESLREQERSNLHKALPAEGMPLAQLEINSKCTGCGNCTVFCPTGALQKTVQDEEPC